MREFQERRRIKKFLHSRYAIIVLLIICVFLGRAVWGVYDKYEKSQQLAEKTANDLKELEERKTKISSLADSLNTDQGIEREIRDRFGLIREGEKVIVIVDNQKKSETEQQDETVNLWQKIINLFR